MQKSTIASTGIAFDGLFTLVQRWAMSHDIGRMRDKACHKLCLHEPAQRTTDNIFDIPLELIH